MEESRLISSYLLKVFEHRKERKIQLQNLRTTEVKEFESYGEALEFLSSKGKKGLR